MAGTDVTFNSVSLQTTNYVVGEVQDMGLSKDFQYLPIIRGNKSVKTNVQYPERSIVIKGKILGTSLSTIKSNVDTFLVTLEGVANLDIDVLQTGSSKRRYIAEPKSIAITQGTALFARDFQVEFVCVDPWGRDTATTSVTSGQTITTSPQTVSSLTFGGTAVYQLPTISMTVTSFTGAYINTITFTNPTTALAMSITRAWTASDAIVIDTLNKTCKVNGTSVDYTGAWLWWSPASGQSIQISDDFTVRSMSLSITNLNLYK